MMLSENYKNPPTKFFRESLIPLFTPEDMAVLYAGLSVLLKIRAEIGMEAMLGYMTKYHAVIGKNNPKLESTVARTLLFMNSERMYWDAMYGEKG